jgi:hypothetical protein
MSLEIGNMYRESHTFLLSLYVCLYTLLACLGSINMSWGPINMSGTLLPRLSMFREHYQCLGDLLTCLKACYHVLRAC